MTRPDETAILLGSAEMRAARVAISGAFFVHGSVFGLWSAQVPSLKARLQIADETFGWLLFLIVVGALAAMIASRFVILRFGSKLVVQVAALVLIATMVLAAIVPTPALLGVLLLVVGFSGNSLDIAMNSQASEAEQLARRAMMSSFHALWSVGGLAGAILGGLLVARVGAAVAVPLMSAVLVGVIAVVRGGLLGVSEVSSALAAKGFSLKGILVLAGIFAGVSMSTDVAVRDWSPLYLTGDFRLDLGYSGFGYGAVACSMAVCRFFGDRIRTAVGDRRLLGISAGVTCLALLIVGFAPTAWIAVAGFVLLGIGISNIFPILLSIAGRDGPSGLALVFALAYLVSLVTVPSFGMISQAAGIGDIYKLLSVALLLSATVMIAFSARKP